MPIRFGATGDEPGAGYGVHPIDAANFAYVGSPPELDGFELLAASGTLNLYAKFTFANVTSASPITYTARILHNGSPVGTAAVTRTGGLRADTGGFNVYATVDAVAGDVFTVDLHTTAITGLTVPHGAGNTTLRFEILSSSVVNP